jgi:hypothetical protein
MGFAVLNPYTDYKPVPRMSEAISGTHGELI